MNTPALQFASPLHHDWLPELQRIEIASSFQIPAFQIVGLPGREVGEARERVRAAIEASHFEFPRRRVVLNLSPANVRKEGTGMDLAMALAVLRLGQPGETESQQAASHERDEKLIVAWGELGLDGRVKPSAQVTRTLMAAARHGASLVLIGPEDPRAISAAVRLIASRVERSRIPLVVPCRTLLEACEALESHLSGEEMPAPLRGDAPDPALPPPPDRDLDDKLLPLHPSLERLIGTCAAGGHHLLLLGARGTGKSHALEWITALQPPLTEALQLEHQLIRELHPQAAAVNRIAALGSFAAPVRRVGLQTRPQALTGGFDVGGAQPGEFSMAHGGLLLADEFPEWNRDAREALREPLERGCSTIVRRKGSAELPARFALAATGNLCPCGGWPAHWIADWKNDESRNNDSHEAGSPVPCRCSELARMNYLDRLSGPVLDRVDAVHRTRTLKPPARGEDESLPLRVERLREKAASTAFRMTSRLGARTGHLEGSRIEAWVDSHLRSAKNAPRILRTLAQAGSLRSRHRVIRLALGLSFWDGTDDHPGVEHFAEALELRPERLGLNP